MAVPWIAEPFASRTNMRGHASMVCSLAEPCAVPEAPNLTSDKDIVTETEARSSADVAWSLHVQRA